MKLQISSGRGPAECELAVGKYLRVLCKEQADLIVKQQTAGLLEGCYKSVVVESPHDLSELLGTVKWVCQSPFRPHHKRKSWFIDVSPVEHFDHTAIDHTQIRYETFRSGGKGGQKVNKVETGVRATYLPLGFSVISTDERSQHLNRKVARERLLKLLAERDAADRGATDHQNWMGHNTLLRGNAVRIYEGLEFKRIL